jgi:hypothetical protein
VLQVSLASTLEDTVTARWRRQLVGAKPHEKRHWRTKVAYYAAVCELLSADAETPLTWRTIVDTVQPKGHRSTFYEIAGPNAKHPLLGALLEEQSSEAFQLVLCYRRRVAVHQLVDESKVWSYWPHRDLLQARFRVAPDVDPGDLLVDTVAAWARNNQGVAGALEHTPPLCAVEDLVAVHDGQLSPQNAYAMLCDTIVEALLPAVRPITPTRWLAAAMTVG